MQPTADAITPDQNGFRAGVPPDNRTAKILPRSQAALRLMARRLI